MGCSSLSSRVSFATLSPTPNTPSVRPSPLSMWSTPSSVKVVPSTVSEVRCTTSTSTNGWKGLLSFSSLLSSGNGYDQEKDWSSGLGYEGLVFSLLWLLVCIHSTFCFDSFTSIIIIIIIIAGDSTPSNTAVTCHKRSIRYNPNFDHVLLPPSFY